MIRERVMAGQAAARARGKRWGRRRGLSVEDEAQVVCMYVAGAATMDELAVLWGVGLGTIKCAIYRVIRPDAPYLTRVRASGSRGGTP